MTDQHSAAFPNLQDLLHHVQGRGRDPAGQSVDAPQVPVGLKEMASRLAAQLESHASQGIPALVPGKEPEPDDVPAFESVTSDMLAAGLELSEPATVSEDAFVASPESLDSTLPEAEAENTHEPEINFLQQFEPVALASEVSPLIVHMEDAGIAPLPEMPHEDLNGRGSSLTLGGLLLLGLALLVACATAPAWVEVLKEKGELAAWTRRLVMARTWLAALAVVGLVRLGMGSFSRRRSAVPLVHAAGWLTAISVLMALAVASAGFFFLAPHSGQFDKAWLREIGGLLVKVGVLGVAVPLLLIAIYQRRHLSGVCALADPRPRWTDALSEPLLMLWQSVLALAALVLCLVFFNNAFPFFGTMLSGDEGAMGIAASAAACLAAAWLLARRQKAGWWLAWGTILLLAGTAAWTLLQVPWPDVCSVMGRPSGLPELEVPTRLPLLLVGAVFAPLVMVLIMSRSAFPTPGESDTRTSPNA